MDTIFQVFDQNNFSYKYSFGIKGQGPNDFILPSTQAVSYTHIDVYKRQRRIQSEKIYFRYLKNIKCEYEKQIETRNSAYYMLKEDIILNFQNNGLRLCLNEIIYEDGTSACHLKDIISDTCLLYTS